MKASSAMTLFFSAIVLGGCNLKNDTTKKSIDTELATIGLLMYNGVFTTELTAVADVFTKASVDDEIYFNVVSIAETLSPVTTKEGLTLIPDFNFKDAPTLDVLFVPSANNMPSLVNNTSVLNFIKRKDAETTYTVSSCEGAQLIGAAGIAKEKQIVTWIGGGEQLQKDYPDLLVQDDATVTYVEDGKFISSNGNLVSYIAALNLLEKMTSPQHRKFVEGQLYLDRLENR